jgi:2-polyprenyl-6-methoxyphenol hydroxylase-like FAD-dependent oxidoreductase
MKLTDSRWDDTGVKFTFANGETTEADFIVGADSVYSEVHPHIVKSELDYSEFMAITGMNIDKHTLRESAQATDFPNFCYGRIGFVPMKPANVLTTEIDFFSDARPTSLEEGMGRSRK